ncbi:hypothetical protein ACF0H5_001742 [Mactra antiquata]
MLGAPRKTELIWILLLVIAEQINLGICRRYRYCSEGCCPEEFCAYHLICYPKIVCTYGCPDGNCKNGICMPQIPCKEHTRCGFSFTCTMNYNLGYNTCQYNLDIGKTLCMDTKGHSLTKPLS